MQRERNEAKYWLHVNHQVICCSEKGVQRSYTDYICKWTRLLFCCPGSEGKKGDKPKNWLHKNSIIWVVSYGWCICFLGTPAHTRSMCWICAPASATGVERSSSCSCFQQRADSLDRCFVDCSPESDIVASGWDSAHRAQKTKQTAVDHPVGDYSIVILSMCHRFQWF